MKISADSDSLTIKLEGWEKVWSLKSRIDVPRAAIASLEILAESPKKNLAWPFIKLPGTELPRVLMAGTFVKPSEKDFWYLRVKHPGVLDIKTKPGGFKYDRILLSCSDADAQAAKTWWLA